MKLPWESVIDKVSGAIDDLHLSSEEEWNLRLRQQELDQRGDLAQIEVNREQAKHGTIFVAGPRPAAMWVCVLGLLYEFLLHPVLLWGWALSQGLGWLPTKAEAPPGLDITVLMSLLGGLLGLSGYRTYEKQRGIDTKSVKQ